eukprot:10180861-Heterocapsa_arctica.AAC.1
MPEHAGPVFNGSEPAGFQLGLTVRLPVPPSVGVSVQGKSENYHWASESLEGLQPPLFRESYPSNDTPQLG